MYFIPLSHEVQNIRQTRFFDFQFRRYSYGSLGMNKNFICKETSANETSIKMARHCAERLVMMIIALEKWKKTHSGSTCALSGISTCKKPFR